VADFVIGNIVIEVDGSSHNSKKQKDALRDSNMRKSGYQVIRLETDELTDWELWDKLGFLVEANRIEKELYSKYCHGSYA
jgi:very-short-patch-repair endonuclease